MASIPNCSFVTRQVHADLSRQKSLDSQTKKSNFSLQPGFTPVPEDGQLKHDSAAAPRVTPCPPPAAARSVGSWFTWDKSHWWSAKKSIAPHDPAKPHLTDSAYQSDNDDAFDTSSIGSASSCEVETRRRHASEPFDLSAYRSDSVSSTSSEVESGAASGAVNGAASDQSKASVKIGGLSIGLHVREEPRGRVASSLSEQTQRGIATSLSNTPVVPVNE